MRFRVTAIVSLALLCTTEPSNATPSTQIWIPSTDIQAFLKPHFGWDVYLSTNGIGTVSNGGITIGVLPFEKIGMEIGFDYRDFSGDHRFPLFVNAKVGVPEHALFSYSPALAVGAYDFSFANSSLKFNILYGLVAMNIWKLGRFSVGGYKGAVGSDPQQTFYVISNPDSDAEDAGVLASWDRTMSEISDRLWLCVDFQSGKSAYGALSVGAAYSFTPSVGVIFGYNYYLDHAGTKPSITLQVDINAW